MLLMRMRSFVGRLHLHAVTMLLLPLTVFAEEKPAVMANTLPHATTVQLVKILLGLMFVLVLIFLLAWLVKKYFGVGMASNTSLKAVAGLAVGQKERLVLVQVGERQILIGVAPGQISMLHALEKGDEVTAASDGTQNSFAEKFKNSFAVLDKK